jgi:hypothetical protein
MEENIQTIKIDEDGKYVLTIKFPSDYDRAVGDKITQAIGNRMNEWWKSDEKFMMFGLWEGGPTIKIERVNE